MEEKHSLAVFKINCWNCDAEMKRFQDTFYWYYRCPKCGKESLVPKEREKTQDDNG